jgi:predicted transcriptional regulator
MRDTQNPALMRAFAAELKARRAVLGISQDELAYRCELNRTFVAKLEVASTQPSLSVLLKIADGLQADLVELLGATMVRFTTERRSSRISLKRDRSRPD